MNKIRIKLNEDFDRKKLTIGQRPWIDNNNSNHPRKGLIYKGEEYTVNKDDRVIKHFLSGGDIKPVEDETNEPVTYTEKLMKLPHINETKAEQLKQRYESYDEFKEEITIEDLTSLDGIGHSRAEKIQEELR